MFVSTGFSFAGRQINRALRCISLSLQLKRLLMFLSTEDNEDYKRLLIFSYFILSRCAPAVTFPHRNTAPQFLPIQTSPNWPFPSFLISWRDSRGISHISLVFTDKSASLGMPRLQLPIKRQHSPAALSEREGRDKQARKRERKKTEGKRQQTQR